jgi:hypothetical protein
MIDKKVKLTLIRRTVDVDRLRGSTGQDQNYTPVVCCHRPSEVALLSSSCVVRIIIIV